MIGSLSNFCKSLWKTPTKSYHWIITYGQWDRLEMHEFKVNWGGTSFDFVLKRDNLELFAVTVYLNQYRDRPTYFLLEVKGRGNQRCFRKHSLRALEERVTITLPILQSNISSEYGYVVYGEINIKITISDDPVDPDATRESPIRDDSVIEIESYHPLLEPADKVPYVGLQNQGATCYMNSILQTLFHCPIFRKFVFQIDEKSDKPDHANVLLQLQNLFARLQTQNTAVTTEALTRSFGWSEYDTVMQHDIEEFCRALIDKIEDKMKGTECENTIADIFKGITQSVVEGITKEFTVKTEEPFYDLSLNVSNCSDLEESLALYVKPQILSDDNKYESREHGLQDAQVFTNFVKLPKVLHIHLKRFQFDTSSQQGSKVNSFFKFPEFLSMGPYMSDPDADAMYELFGVIVHSGTSLSGHYYAFLRTSDSPDWYKFNDSTVEKVPKEKAIEANYGGDFDFGVSGSIDKNFSAYFLMYVRSDCIGEVYQDVPVSSIPERVMARIQRDPMPVKRCMEFEILTDNVIRSHALAGNLNLSSGLRNEMTVLTMYDGETVDDLFGKIHGLIGDKVSLWSIDMNQKLTKIDQSKKEIDTLLGRTTIYVGPPEPSFSFTRQVLVFVFFYFKDSPHPLRFIGTRFAFVSDKIYSLGMEYPEIYGNLKASIAHYNILESVDAKKSLRDIEIEDGTMIVFEPLNCSFPVEADEVIPLNYDSSIINYFNVTENRPRTAVLYMEALSECFPVELHSRGTTKTISVPLRHVHFNDFCDVVRRCFGANPSDLVMFYVENDVYPIHVVGNVTLNVAFGLNINKKIHVCFASRDTYSEDDSLLRIEFQWSEDCVHITETHEEVLQANNVEEIVTQIGHRYQSYTEHSSVRVFLVPNNEITCLVTHKTALSEIQNPIRMEPIFADTDDMYWVSFDPNDRAPFLLERECGEKLADLRKRVLAKAGNLQDILSLKCYSADKELIKYQTDDPVGPELKRIIVRLPTSKRPAPGRSIHIWN